ncbi:GNAT family N-acetyltransferase [Oceaniglobus ichthyenteri]|uniref:GNAT family N-acetyltransferase n=1 Tax=Oceaniglobus ichthyenteri TaxID=2136177 RepID=UPI001F0C9A92|nr:GNAT family N-acetyltransferase [Oceaniglobus ichthyenteri]
MTDDLPNPDQLFAALAATWPAAAQTHAPPFLLRDGAGGGKRVSAASVIGPVGPDDIANAEIAMARLGHPPLFSLRGNLGPVDALLADRGYRMVDPTVIRACPVGALSRFDLPRLAAFTLWEPLEIMREIWAEGGIGPERMAVMARVTGPKTALLGRSQARAAGAGFVALHGDIAMVHALEIRANARRQGAARHMMIAAAKWAQSHGARHMAIAVTQANGAANGLYTSLNMPVCATYHYRIKDGADE